MLDDAERKLLRVLFNFYTLHRRMPVWRELTAMTYKSRSELIHTLLTLEKMQYIQWKDHASLHTVVMLEGWERQQRHARRNTNSHASASYWTEY